MVAPGERVFTVAPGTPHRTPGKPYKSTWAAGMSGFSLDREKDFSHPQHIGILDSGFQNVDLRGQLDLGRSVPAPLRIEPATSGGRGHQT